MKTVIDSKDRQIDLASQSATSTMLTAGNLDLNANGVAIINIKSLASANGNWSIGEDGRIVAKSICIDGNCLDGENVGDVIASSKRTGAIQIIGNYAYMLNAKTHSLRVLDMTNQDSPSIISTLALEEGVATIAASGNMLYISNDDMSKLYLVDISTPINPILVRSMDTTGTVATAPVPVDDAGSAPSGEVAGDSTSEPPSEEGGTPIPEPSEEESAPLTTSDTPESEPTPETIPTDSPVTVAPVEPSNP